MSVEQCWYRTLTLWDILKESRRSIYTDMEGYKFFVCSFLTCYSSGYGLIKLRDFYKNYTRLQSCAKKNNK